MNFIMFINRIIVTLIVRFVDRYRDIICFFLFGSLGYIVGYFVITSKIRIDSWFWVHSTIAQSLAALIAISAIFLFHVLGKIDMQKEKIINKCKVLCLIFYEKVCIYYKPIPEYAVTHFDIDDFHSLLKNLKTIAIKNSAYKKPEAWKIDYMIEHLQTNICEYNRLLKLKEYLKSRYFIPFYQMIIVIIWAIIFLPSRQISVEWLSRNEVGWLLSISIATSYTLGLMIGFLRGIFTMKIEK